MVMDGFQEKLKLGRMGFWRHALLVPPSSMILTGLSNANPNLPFCWIFWAKQEV
jgi:hypothetical protein